MIKLSTILISILSTSLCWWNTGHLIVADIAMKNTLLKIPESKSFFEDLTKIMYPRTHGRVTNFRESSVWPDLTKSYGNRNMNNLHYKDLFLNETMTSMPFIDPLQEKSSSISFMVSVSFLLIYFKLLDKCK